MTLDNNPDENRGDGDQVTASHQAQTAEGVVSGKDLCQSLYLELRQLAAIRMAREKPQTLQATALVHEAWLKLGEQNFQNRAHFFGAAAEAMRRSQAEAWGSTRTRRLRGVTGHRTFER